MGWEPFFHLATGDQVWDLFRDGQGVEIPHGGKKKRYRAFVLKNANEAVLKPHLLGFVQTMEGRQAVREAVLEMLRADESPASRHLLAKAFGGSAGTSVITKTAGAAQDWTDAEVELTVNDYFSMLRAELDGVPFNKAAHRKALLLKFARRSGPAVEFKHCNISAVLNEQSLRYITGYKPRGNFQESLAKSVAAYLTDHSDVHERIVSAVPSTPTEDPPVRELRIEDIETPPPAPKTPGTGQPGHGAASKTDWGLLDSKNRSLGRRGEELVLELERRHLSEIGRHDLSKDVEWVSEKRGDGDGYDILSFDDTGNPRYIEVKTTNAGRGSSFFISSNEVQVAQHRGESYWLYRVYNFGSGPKLYRLQGPLGEKLDLEPKVYAARVGIGCIE